MLAVLYTGACAQLGGETGFFTVLNDFWGNAFAATHWSWSAAQQWNGFFPPGYPTILAFLPGARLVESAYYFNVLAGVGLFLATWSFARRQAGEAAALAASVAVSLHPLVLTQVLTTGPDAAFVALAVSGVLVLFRAVEHQRAGWLWPAAAGLCLGAATWLRFHGLTWAPAVLGATLLVGRARAWPAVWRTAIVFGACVLPLAAVGLAAGDLGAVARDQAFNVYSRLVRPVNWFHLDREPIPRSIAEAIARDPAAFWRNYLAFGTPHLWFGAVGLVAAAVSRGGARRFALTTLIAGVVFVPLVNLGASPRGVASYVPLVVLAAAWALADVLSRVERRRVRAMGTAAVCAMAVGYAWQSWRPEIRQFVDAARIRSTVSRQIETSLRADRVKLATQVFGVADFYFVDAPGWHVGNYFPRIKGGWPTLDLPLYLETYPPPSTASLDAFLDDCQRFGVSHLVLSEAAGGLLRELGQLYDGRLTSPRTQDVVALPGIRILRIVG